MCLLFLLNKTYKFKSFKINKRVKKSQDIFCLGDGQAAPSLPLIVCSSPHQSIGSLGSAVQCSAVQCSAVQSSCLLGMIDCLPPVAERGGNRAQEHGFRNVGFWRTKICYISS